MPAVRQMSNPSASQAVGWSSRSPRSRSPALHAVRRSAATAMRPAAGRGVLLVQHALLEVQQLWLVEFVERGAGGPVEPVGAGIEAGGQQHLAGAGLGGSQQEVIEEPSADDDTERESGTYAGELPRAHRRALLAVERIRCCAQ